MHTVIKFQVIDQTLQAVNLPKLASGGRKSVRAEFSFDVLWDGFGKVAVFYRDQNLIHHALLVNGACEVPWSILFDPGMVHVSVFGESGGVTRTTEELVLTIEKGAVTGTTTMEPAPDVYRQVLAAYGSTEQRVVDVERDLAVERARVNAFTAMAEGSTTGDAELIDARVDYEGKTHANVGTAVREQVGAVNKLAEGIMSIDGVNPLQPLMFNRYICYKGGTTYDLYDLDRPRYEIGDIAHYHQKEQTSGTSFAIGGQLVNPIPVGDAVDGKYHVVIESDAAFSAYVIMSSQANWGVTSVRKHSKAFEVKKGTNIIPLVLEDATMPGATGDFYHCVMFRSGVSFEANFSAYIVRGAGLLGWLSENVNSVTPSIVCWGDSLTAQGGWTDKLAALSGLTVLNAGTGGEPSSTIMARQGADVMLVNGITIPAAVEPVIVATYGNGFLTEFGRHVRPLLQGGTAHVNPVKIGGIEGTLAWTGSSYDDVTGVWTFTRAEAGEALVIDRPTAMRTAFDRLHNKPENIPIFFMGTNDGVFDVDDMVNRHRLAILRACADRFLVLGLSRVPGALKGKYEAAMRSAFGRNFLSLREYLLQYGLADQGLTATNADTLALKNGDIPPQLLRDNTHYTDATRAEIGKQVYKRLIELNYI